MLPPHLPKPRKTAAANPEKRTVAAEADGRAATIKVAGPRPRFAPASQQDAAGRKSA
jgi:hypothetical protein